MLIEQVRAKTAALERASHAATAHPAYIRWEDGQITGVACKLCGNPIVLRGRATPQYCEVRVIFDDKSAHITPLCRPCRDKGLDKDMLEAVYCDDMKILALEEELTQTLMCWRMWSERKPVGFVPI